jgi:hypothetical protein
MNNSIKSELYKWVRILQKMDEPMAISYLEELFDCRYDEGYQDGLSAYAWWKDGEQLVGTSGKTLKQAIENRRTNFNYTGERNDG